MADPHQNSRTDFAASADRSSGQADAAGSADVAAKLQSMTLGDAVRTGVLLRCPACRQGTVFRDWFRMHDRCERCGFQIDRPAGYFLGSTYINYGLTAVLVTGSYVVMNFGLGWHKDRLLPGLLIFCLIFPLVFFRFARSLWLSLDCYLDRVGATEALPRSPGKKIPEERCSKG